VRARVLFPLGYDASETHRMIGDLFKDAQKGLTLRYPIRAWTIDRAVPIMYVPPLPPIDHLPIIVAMCLTLLLYVIASSFWWRQWYRGNLSYMRPYLASSESLVVYLFALQFFASAIVELAYEDRTPGGLALVCVGFLAILLNTGGMIRVSRTQKARTKPANDPRGGVSTCRTKRLPTLLIPALQGYKNVK